MHFPFRSSSKLLQQDSRKSKMVSKKIEKKTIASGKDSTGDCTLESKYIHSNSKRLSQYLELRFSVGVRMVGCLFFILEYVSSFL